MEVATLRYCCVCDLKAGQSIMHVAGQALSDGVVCTRVLDVLTERPHGVSVLFQSSEPFQPFERPLPEVVETSLFDDFEDLLSETQVRRARHWADHGEGRTTGTARH